jgi:tetratricopeptide (TPR) repeat protein
VKLESPGLDENKTLIGLPEMETAHFGSDAFPPGEIEVVGLEGEVASGFDTLAGIVGRLLAKTATERYHDAYEVITDLCAAINQPVPEESAAIRESFLVAAKFVGRETELGALEAALAQSVQGKGSAWLLSGESGVGKSRLSDELRTRALVQGVVVLRSEGVAGGGLPYELWREPLRRLALTTDLTDLEAGILCDLVQDIDHLLEHPIPEAVHLEGTAYQNRLLGTIASVFQRQTQPLLLLLEDLQWSSESLEVLRLLNGMVGELPVMIVGNYRHEERPGLPDELPGMHILKVERLTAKSIAELSVSMLGEAGRQKDVLELLQRETEGNVYFLVEVMRALAEEAGRLDRVGQMSLPQHVVAGGIQAVIRRRLERVPEEGRLLVQLAAVAGRELDLAVLEHVNGALDIDEWLTICANVAVLEVQDGQWRFSHDKLRESTLNALPPDRLAALHGQIAQAIEATYPDSEDQAVRLSQHWRNAGNVNKELYYLRLAGDHAMHISVYADAISYYERALELLPSASLAELDPQSIEADLFIKLGEALQHIGDYPKATRRLEMGLERSRRLNDNAGAARALGVLSDVYWRQGDYARATDACQESLALSRSIDDPRGIARALNRLGMVASEQGNYAEAVRNLEESLAFAGQSGDLEASATVINNLGTVAYAQGDYDRASRYFEETLAISQASGERRKAATALLNLGSVAGEKGDYARATQHFEETLAICRAIGERRGVALALDNLGFLAELQGNHTAAIKHFEASLAIARAIGNRRGSATTLVNLGNVSRAQGQTERAIDFYHQALSLAREIEAIPTIMEILTGLAGVVSDTRSALAWLGLVLSHSATFEATRKQATRILDEKFRPMVSARQIEDGLQQGKGLDVMAVVTKILQERADSYFAQR